MLVVRSGRDVRVVEGARLESACTPKGYRGFESHSLRRYSCISGIYKTKGTKDLGFTPL